MIKPATSREFIRMVLEHQDITLKDVNAIMDLYRKAFHDLNVFDAQEKYNNDAICFRNDVIKLASSLSNKYSEDIVRMVIKHYHERTNTFIIKNIKKSLLDFNIFNSKAKTIEELKCEILNYIHKDSNFWHDYFRYGTEEGSFLYSEYCTFNDIVKYKNQRIIMVDTESDKCILVPYSEDNINVINEWVNTLLEIHDDKRKDIVLKAEENDDYHDIFFQESF